MLEIFEIGKRYVIIYDDKGYKPVKKEVTVISKEGNLLQVDTRFGREIINTHNIIRAGELENGTTEHP
jgi:hypothetical protein